MEFNIKLEYPKPKNPEDKDSVQKAPVGLRLLCILTFIGSGFMLLAYLLFFFMYSNHPEMMAVAATIENSLAAIIGNSLADDYIKVEMFRNAPRYFFLLMTTPYLFSIIGSGCMVRLRRFGFHLYVVGQILLLSFPILIQKMDFDLSGLLFSLVFIAL
ncbi:MAG: hypothetical protein LBE13_06480, partial [Bacteroidales bacterium]|nr:hypothetical protein [Bacteroidales bacterium]